MAQSSDDFDPKRAFEDVFATLNQPDRFAKVFCEAAASQISIQETLKTIITKALENDVTTRNIVKVISKESIKDERLQYFFKIGAWTIFAIGTIVSAYIGGGYLKF